MKLIILLMLAALPFKSLAQDELFDLLDREAEPQTDYASATFKATRIISAHSIESMKEGQLEFRISHRFGRLNTGAGELWGLDQSSIFLSLEYGATDWLEIGVGRTPVEKTINGFTKIRILRQSSGASIMPVAISYFGSLGINTSPWSEPDRENYFSSRLAYVQQLLVARKFNDDFSLQVTPTLIHRNLVPAKSDENDVFALGIGGRYKLSSRFSVNFEYFHKLNSGSSAGINFINPLSIGVDIETGGHVFQIMLSNSSGMIEKHYIADNTGDWGNGDIHLGFNISRVFSLTGD